MKNEELKSPRKHEGKSKDYLLTIKVGGLARKVVWNDHTVFHLDHPHAWTISKLNENIYLCDSSDPSLETRVDNSISIPTDGNHTVAIEIPQNYKKTRKAFDMTIAPLEPLQPPYKQVLYSGPATPLAPRQLLMYQGVRHFLLKYRPVGHKLTARTGQESVFKYDKVSHGYSITPFTGSLVVKSKGKKQNLSIGIPFIMNETDFFAASFMYGIYWWRFRSVISPDALPPLEEEDSEDAEREALRFTKTSRAVSIALLMLLVCALSYNHFFPPKPEMIITKIELKAPKVIPHKEIAEVKPTPAPTPPPEPPKKEEKKKEVVKKEPPKPEPKKVVKKEPPPKKIVKKEPPAPKKVAKVEPKKVEPKKAPPQIAKTEPTHKKEPPVQTMPVKKAIDTPPATGVVAKKTEAPPAPDESAQLLKSLSFLSSGSKNPKKGSLAKYDKNAKKDFMNSPTLGGSTKDSNALDAISAKDGDTNIKTRSSRMIAADAGFGSPKGKGLNDVQGKVSLTELYSGGKGGGFEEGASLSLSGPGDLSEAEIEKALAKFIGRFQFCYEKALLSDSSLGGNIRLQWTIKESGKVSDSKVINSQMKNASLHSCILGVLKDVPFPHPKGGPVTAKKTFSFKSSSI